MKKELLKKSDVGDCDFASPYKAEKRFMP